MFWFKAHLDRRWDCGNYKVMDYWLQARTLNAARRHVQQRHPGWRLITIGFSPAAPEIPT